MKKIMVVMLTIIVVCSISGLVFESNELQYTETTEVYIRPGDTLWKIASGVNSGRYNNHKIVLEIKDLNDDLYTGSGGCLIIPGQKIKVPVLNSCN